MGAGQRGKRRLAPQLFKVGIALGEVQRIAGLDGLFQRAGGFGHAPGERVHHGLVVENGGWRCTATSLTESLVNRFSPASSSLAARTTTEGDAFNALVVLPPKPVKVTP